MIGKLTIEITHEEYLQLMDHLRFPKAAGKYSADPNIYAIKVARRIIGLPMESRHLFSDWTPEDEEQEQAENTRQMEEIYKANGMGGIL
jgi:hypothetical protein